MRLRQAVSHPLNLEKFLRESDREESIQMAMERLKEEAEAIQNDADKAEAHAHQLAQDEAGRETFSTGVYQMETLYKDWFGGAEEMAQLRTLAANEQEVKEVTCGFCKKATPPVDPTRNANVCVNSDSVGSDANRKQCEHIYCEKCIIVGTSKAMGTVKVGFRCPMPGCSAKLGVGESLTTPTCIQKSVNEAKALKTYQESGKDSIGTKWGGDRDGRTSFFLATSGRNDIHYGPVNMPLGSKVKATMEVILTWVKEAPEDKIIGKISGWTLYHRFLTVCLVFVEFTRTAKALGCILEKMGLNFLYYNRTANAKQKDKALREFRENPEQKIFVGSLLPTPSRLVRNLTR